VIITLQKTKTSQRASSGTSKDMDSELFIGITLFFIICRNRDVVLFMKANKLIIIGIDSFLHDFVEEFASKGLMPTIKQLMKKGAYGYALPSMKTYLKLP